MRFIILESINPINIKVNKKVYKVFANIKNYNSNLITFDNKKNIIIKKEFINKKVPNIIRYEIDLFNKSGEIKINSILNKKNIIKNSNYYDILLDNESKIDNSIALILESPHKAEFNYINNNLKPISPAQGSTGKNIDDKIKLLLEEIIENNYYNFKKENYKLVIINPISFQTSLHFFHKKSLSNYHFKKLRDEIWRRAWEQDCTYKTNLINDLNRINSDLIINACTSQLSPLIQKFLKENFSDTVSVKSYHPSAWVFNGFGLN